MHPHIETIWKAVQGDLAQGKVVDVEAYCRSFAPLCPDLTHKQLEDIILELVTIRGGGAVWGRDRSGGGTPPISKAS